MWLYRIHSFLLKLHIDSLSRNFNNTLITQDFTKLFYPKHPLTQVLHDVTESGNSAGKRVNISSQDPHSALSSTSQSTRAVSAWQPISAFLSSAVLRTPLLWTDCHLLQPTLPMWPWKPGSTPFMSSRKLPWSPQKGLDTSALCFPHYIIASPSQKGCRLPGGGSSAGCSHLAQQPRNRRWNDEDLLYKGRAYCIHCTSPGLSTK